MGRILLVSNRLPVTATAEDGAFSIRRSAGGLASGLRGAHECGSSLWIGWPGALPRLSARQTRDLLKELADNRTVPVTLSPQEVRGYYEGISNGVIWPLFHYMTDRLPLRSGDWEMYRRVNERFADAVVANYQPGDLIWVHDYQLALLPAMLRERIPDAAIGFFLHIPFPSSELFSVLPWREEYLRGMLGADLIGFHTSSYLRHFATSLMRFIGAEVNVDRVACAGRDVRLGAFPMGIDARAFSALAGEEQVQQEIDSIRHEAGDRKIIVGIDRLDYTKGIPQRLLAIEQLLLADPSLAERIRVIQVTVPSRERVDAYAGLRRQVDELIGRINGRFATSHAVPIHNIYRSLSEREVVALYGAADVMLVTPLRDGMNLVAKEFVAARIDEDGVLVLSEFAGSAAELGEALSINPYDIQGVAARIREALAMPRDERRERMSAMRGRVLRHDVHRWAERFVEAAKNAAGRRTSRPQSYTPQHELEAAFALARSAPELLLLLDYDGTLVPFQDTPGQAQPDPELIELLDDLSARPNTSVHLVSGRTRSSLDRWLGRLPVGLHAEHGLWSRPSPEHWWAPLQSVPTEWKDKVRPLLEHVTSMTPGSLVEEKTASLAWHYRMADPAHGAMQAKELRLLLAELLSNVAVELTEGEKVIEIRPQGVNKGLIARSLLAGPPRPLTVVAMGDDATDEDLFAALPPDSVSVHVGPRPSIARYRVEDQAAARRLLRSLLGRPASLPAGAVPAYLAAPRRDGIKRTAS